ncbi:hypothetical protein HDU79_010331 [Rhizoclosmatium sp. JEL0117]|nr:hypothetical protein HDU79_010331 [Rhizoclosmatium sp. JEL0117]
MQKYARWKDPITGINPFLPTKARLDDRDPLALVKPYLWSFKKLVGPLLSVAKLGVVAILFGVGYLVMSIGFVYSAVPAMKRAWTVGVAFVFGRLSLALLGFYFIDKEQVWLKKSLREKQELKKTTVDSIESGDMIIANHSSYVDILFLFTLYAPVFTEISSETKLLRTVSFVEAMMRTGEYPTLNNPNDTQTLAQICKHAKEHRLGPVVVFAEGTTSNGRALLKLVDIFDGVDVTQHHVHVFGIRYPFEDFSPTYIVGGKLSHLIGLGAQWYNNLDVKVCMYSPSLFWKSVEQEGIELSKEAIESILVQTTKLKMTSLGVSDKKEFFDFWMDKDTSGASNQSATDKKTQ